MLIELIDVNFEYDDDRGKLVQLVREGYSQVNYTYSKKGTFRGNHYHKLNKEAFYVIRGEFKLLVSKEQESEEYIFKNGDMFIILSEVLHSFDFMEDTELISLYDRGVELDDGTKDIY